MANRLQVATQLDQIRVELIQLSLWQAAAPPAAALQSTEPFCIDTLDLSQWLQWILLPRMHALLDEGLPLPGNCNIHPIAEQNFNGFTLDCNRLLTAIRELDRTLG
ncbi:MAG: YqcC family protein [Motiliproteus sp.]